MRNKIIYRQGYKVVRTRNTDMLYYSATDLGQSIFYNETDFTDRPYGCGPLTVFTKVNFACDFAQRRLYLISHQEALVVFKCLYKASKDNSVWIKYSNKRRLTELPPSSALADKIKLEMPMYAYV